MSFRALKQGDKVTRMLGGALPMAMIVREVKEDVLVCDAVQKDGSIFLGEWIFDRDLGCEEDPELGWGKKFGKTGSQLVKEMIEQ